MNKTLFTIGYTGIAIDEFLEQLQEARITLLLDVRELPISRKRGFSKTALADNLKRTGIEYRHFKWLGSPKALRHEVRDTREYDTFFSGVARHLRQPDAVSQLEEAVELARKFRSCLMCCCEKWQLCHRRCVVDAVLKNQHFTVKHLREPIAEQAICNAA